MLTLTTSKIYVSFLNLDKKHMELCKHWTSLSFKLIKPNLEYWDTSSNWVKSYLHLKICWTMLICFQAPRLNYNYNKPIKKIKTHPTKILNLNLKLQMKISMINFKSTQIKNSSKMKNQILIRLAKPKSLSLIKL